MDKNKCYLCEKLCYSESPNYEKCEYRRCRSFGMPENRMYEEACMRLAVKFGRKHDWLFGGWAGHFDPTKHNWYEGAGGHAMFDDLVFSLDDMRADLMMDAHPDAILKYYDECMEEHYAAEREQRPAVRVNYRSWLLGARHDASKCTEEYLALRDKELAEGLERLHRTREQLEEELKEMAQRDADDLLAGSDGLY